MRAVWLHNSVAALPLLGKTLEREDGVFPVAPRWGFVWDLFFVWQGFHCISPPAYYPPSLRDLGCGTKEPQRGDGMLGRRWSTAEPLPMKMT